MGNLQEKALIAYERIKAERGEVTFIDAFIEGYTQAKAEIKEQMNKSAFPARLCYYSDDLLELCSHLKKGEFHEDEVVRIVIIKQ